MFCDDFRLMVRFFLSLGDQLRFLINEAVNLSILCHFIFLNTNRIPVLLKSSNFIARSTSMRPYNFENTL